MSALHYGRFGPFKVCNGPNKVYISSMIILIVCIEKEKASGEVLGIKDSTLVFVLM